jgi:hypothetical protein
MAPLFIYLAAFYLYPLIYSIYMGFFEWSMGDPTKTFVGIRNYVDAFHDSQFIGSFLNTGIFVVSADAPHSPGRCADVEGTPESGFRCAHLLHSRCRTEYRTGRLR